eukprot:6202120-Prorocentrum_lima.AAC.1
MIDVTHQTDRNAVPGILQWGIYSSAAMGWSKAKTMIHMLPYAPESGHLKTGYINPTEGHVAVRIRIRELVSDRHE